MAKEQIVTDQAPRPSGAYSQGLRMDDYLWVASQGPYDPVTRAIVGTTIEEQTARTLDNVKAILEAGGATMADVAMNHIFLKDLSDYAAFNGVYAEYFPGVKPARYCIRCDLVKPDCLVEIASVAHLA